MAISLLGTQHLIAIKTNQLAITFVTISCEERNSFIVKTYLCVHTIDGVRRKIKHWLLTSTNVNICQSIIDLWLVFNTWNYHRNNPLNFLLTNFFNTTFFSLFYGRCFVSSNRCPSTQFLIGAFVFSLFYVMLNYGWSLVIIIVV